MFAKLKGAAQEAASAGYAAASDVAVAAKSRVDVAQGAKKMVDEGGEPMEKKLLAKRATTEATGKDQVFLQNYSRFLDSYSDAVQKLSEGTVHAQGETPSFEKLTTDYMDRIAAWRSGTDKLQQPIPENATISDVERDAIAIVWTKNKAKGVRASISGATSTCDGTSGCDGTNEGEASGTSGWMAKAQGHFDVTRQKAGDALTHAGARVDAAMPGKKMVDEGGVPIKAKLLAKKASVDAVAADDKMVALLEQTIGLYDSAVEQLRASLPNAAGESPAFDKLAADFSARVTALKALQSSLAKVPEAATCSHEERNGILYLITTMQVTATKEMATKSVQDAQGKAAELAMGQALSQATGGRVDKAPEGSGSAAVTFAKENPELAKAAVQAASKNASSASG